MIENKKCADKLARNYIILFDQCQMKLIELTQLLLQPPLRSSPCRRGLKPRLQCRAWGLKI